MYVFALGKVRYEISVLLALLQCPLRLPVTYQINFLKQSLRRAVRHILN